MILSSDLLHNKVVLITGCNRGIGKAMLQHFVQYGAIVYACARKEGSLESIINETSDGYKQNIIPLYFDVTDSETVKQAFMRINKEQNRLDCLINNAGIMEDAIIGMVSKQLSRKLFETNVFAVIDLMQYAVKLMHKHKSGSIVNISSIVGTNGNSGQIVYSGTKGAIIAITKTAAKELANKNIRVNAIAPGIIDTDMLASIGSERVQKLKSQIGMGRLGTPDDIADVAVFLASDLSKYTTGQIIGVDGSTII
jgi:3-oxoacyl-[acyl-carrier protein] reductase